MSGESSQKSTLVPKLRFPEFRGAEEWTLEAGNTLFDQINDRNPEPGLPVLAITQEHGAIPLHLIDYHVSVTEKSIESYKVVRIGDLPLGHTGVKTTSMSSTSFASTPTPKDTSWS